MTIIKKGKTFGYSINLNERGYFEADVRTNKSETIWGIDTAVSISLREDHGINDLKNPKAIEAYLIEHNIIGKDDQVLSLNDAESVWEDEDTVDLRIANFEGFYNSIHDMYIDDAIDSNFMDEDGMVEVPDEFHNEFTIRGPVMEKYCEKYTELYKDYLKSEFEIDIPSLKFESVESPREYNTKTDVIFATVKASELEAAIKKWMSSADKEDYEKSRKYLCDHLSTTSGFHSYYDHIVDLSASTDDVFKWLGGSEIKEVNDVNIIGFVFSSMTGEIRDESIMNSNCAVVTEVVNTILWESMSDKAKDIANKWYTDRNPDTGITP